MRPEKCTHCGGNQLQQGFIEDSGNSSRGYSRWIEGELELGVFGGARRVGRPRWAVAAYRCASCAHLELFAHDRV